MPAATESVGFATEKDGVLETEAAIEETEKIQSIYNGNGTFYDLDEKKEFTKESYRLTDEFDGLPIAVRWTGFLVADIDQAFTIT